ncbi:MAG: hypothetical protein MJ138_05690, partial [Kiritimatiellae bacterium]|nr:hypothetical protein [Kiritimatiellia bacterium]
MKWLGKYGDARGGWRFLVLSAAVVFSFAGFGDGERNAETLFYVRHGDLIGHWDGFENAGRGVQDASATTWTDLTGVTGNLAVNSSAAFDAADGCLVRENGATVGGDARMAYGANGVSEWRTIEVVAKRTVVSQYSVLFSPNGNTTGLLAVKSSSIGSDHTKYFTAPEFTTGQQFATLTLVRRDSGWYFYQNGYECNMDGTSESWGSGMTEPLAVRGRAATGHTQLHGRVYAIRLYSNALSAEEIAVNAAIDRARFVDKASVASLEFTAGKIVATVPASNAARQIFLYAAREDHGMDDWGEAVASATIAAGETSATFAKPAGWGTSVFFARAKVVDGGDVAWLNAVVWEPAAEIGLSPELTLVASAFGSSEIAATVTGVGVAADSATLTFAYGTAQDSLDGETVVVVNGSGKWTGTLQRLVGGQTYYVRATLDNGVDEPVSSDVCPFRQPEIKETGCAETLFYARTAALVGHWDGFENAGRGVQDASAARWIDLTGVTGDLVVNPSAAFNAADGCLVRDRQVVTGSDSSMA